MRRRRERGLRSTLRALSAGLLAGALLAAPSLAANLLPQGFFDRLPSGGSGQAVVEADSLTFDRNANTIMARGTVAVAYLGYKATGDRLQFNQTTGDIELVGNVRILAPDGTEYETDSVSVTGGFKQAILNSLVMVTTDGAMITGSSATHVSDVTSTLEDGTYAPCGTCIDSKGRRIGWRVRSGRIVYNADDKSVELYDPVLEVLGVPIAWVPYLSLPDPSDPRATGFRLPNLAFGDYVGVKVEVPYFYRIDDRRDLIFSPALISTQGLLFALEYNETIQSVGTYSIKGSGIYQLDRAAFAGRTGDRDWRGALQTTGRFTPAENWTAGWSYTAFTDPGFLIDYLIETSDPALNEVFAEYLDRETFAEARVQEFALLGEVTALAQAKQARAIPRGRFEGQYNLGPGRGTALVSATAQNLSRSADSTETVNGVTYVEGFQGNKAQLSVEAGWKDRWIHNSGLVTTPYLGLRADAANYDGASALMPTASSLYTVTPIAALDMRYPLVASDGGSTYLFEPILQLVYRGSDTTRTGIVNDTAQSFVLDDANIFSFNRFSGPDRQETGLRANIGGHYQANFVDDSHLDAVLGQSYHLAGTNAFAVSDEALVGTSSGLENTASYIVAGLGGGFGPVNFGTKLQYDAALSAIRRAAVAVDFARNGWRASADYSYLRADPALGILADQHDAGASLTVPVDDYWSVTGTASYDLTKGELIDHTALLQYNDGYLAVGAHYDGDGADPFNPTNRTFKLSFKLLTPDGKSYGY